MKTRIVLVMVLSFSICSFFPVFAHPGNTAADGCHYCRTNCDKWGVPWNERHCHNGASAPAPIVQEDEPVYVLSTKYIQPPTLIPTNIPRSSPTRIPTEVKRKNTVSKPKKTILPRHTVTRVPTKMVTLTPNSSKWDFFKWITGRL